MLAGFQRLEAGHHFRVERMVVRAMLGSFIPAGEEMQMARFVLLAVLALCGHIPFAVVASAQGYPTQTVRFIIPFGPASGTDITARLLADRLAVRWGKSVGVENRPGGHGP